MFQAKAFSSNFCPTDDLESRSPWRSFTRPRLHPWTSLALGPGNLRDWLVPDRLSAQRKPLAGPQPDVARGRGEQKKERSRARRFATRPCPLPTTPTQHEHAETFNTQPTEAVCFPRACMSA